MIIEAAVGRSVWLCEYADDIPADVKLRYFLKMVAVR